jgi:hypothetical protein
MSCHFPKGFSRQGVYRFSELKDFAEIKKMEGA